MKLVSRLSSADGFDGVDHEDSGDEGDGEGESGRASPAASTAEFASQPAKVKKKKFHIADFFNAALFFADRLKFLCCACKKKFNKEDDKIKHLNEVHADREQTNYDAEEKRKNHAFPPEVRDNNIYCHCNHFDTGWGKVKQFYQVLSSFIKMFFFK